MSKQFEVSADWMLACGYGHVAYISGIVKVEDNMIGGKGFDSFVTIIDPNGHPWVVATARGRFVPAAKLNAANLFALVNAGKMIHAGQSSTLRKVGDRFVMTADWNPGHSLAVDVTTAERLHAHWEGFKFNTRAKLSDDTVA